MTAESRLNSGKTARLWAKRGFRPLKLRARSQPHWLSYCRVDQDTVKRWFDVVFSLLVLIVFSPVYLLLAFLVALSSPGPIFYVQRRVGKNHRHFGCLKFRTMVRNADELLEDMMETHPHLRQEFENNFKLKHDPRITWIGRFLRVTSLDEFPQFWNVLKGDMSVVGPRPLVPEELPKYGHYIHSILTIRPGITCVWQVSGRNDIPYDLRIQMDLNYVYCRHFWLDMLLIFRTIGVVVFPKDNGAY
jgi:lipopolysaccharide/colanic/teichoic acid biosynthesis glycosyltransferase